jgi:hypothetical protein
MYGCVSVHLEAAVVQACLGDKQCKWYWFRIWARNVPVNYAVRSTEAWAKSSRRQENSAIILVLEFRSIYLDGSLNPRAPPHQISPKI